MRLGRLPAAEVPLDNVEGLAAVFGGSIPAEIWHDFMTAALANAPVRQFVAPATIPTASTSSVSYPQAGGTG